MAIVTETYSEFVVDHPSLVRFEVEMDDGSFGSLDSFFEVEGGMEMEVLTTANGNFYRPFPVMGRIKRVVGSRPVRQQVRVVHQNGEYHRHSLAHL